MKKTAFLLLLTIGTFAVAQKHDEKHETAAQEAAEHHKGKAAQITNGPVVEYVSDHSAMVAWTTNVQSSSKLMYGTDKANLSQTAEKPWGGTNHRLEIKGLQPSTTYYFRVESAQGAGTGTSADSGEGSFTTVAKGAKADRKNVNEGVHKKK